MDNKIEITKSVLFAMKRTNSLNLDADDIAKDICGEFVGRIGLKEVMRGIKKGSLGYYGEAKNINYSSFGSWITKHLKEIS